MTFICYILSLVSFPVLPGHHPALSQVFFRFFKVGQIFFIQGFIVVRGIKESPEQGVACLVQEVFQKPLGCQSITFRQGINQAMKFAFENGLPGDSPQVYSRAACFSVFTWGISNSPLFRAASRMAPGFKWLYLWVVRASLCVNGLHDTQIHSIAHQGRSKMMPQAMEAEVTGKARRLAYT